MTEYRTDFAVGATTLGSATQADREWKIADAKRKRIKKVVAKFDASVTAALEADWRVSTVDYPVEKKTNIGTDVTWVPPVDAVDEGLSDETFVFKFPQLSGRTVKGYVMWED